MTVDDHNIITRTSTDGTTRHDHKGNITRPSDTTYYYDDWNQLTAVILTPTKLYSFACDGKRRKRKQIEFNLVGSTWTPIAETWYIYDGMTVIQERSSSNVPTVHYTRGLDLSGSLGGAGGIGGLLTRSSGYNSSTGAWSTHDYYHADGSGNITMLISNSSTPTIQAQYEYDPFGRIQTQSGTLASTNTQCFSSKNQIGTFPLICFGYRFHHSDTQRWMNRDPIEERGGVNLYGFVGNDPISSVDPVGLSKANCPPNPKLPITCCDLLKWLEEQAKCVQIRHMEQMLAPRHLYPNNVGEDGTTWDGHTKQYNEQKRRLKRWRNFFDKHCGGGSGTKLPQVVLDWVNKPVPVKPLWALPRDWTQHMPGTPQQLENIGMVSGLAGSAILISTGVGAGAGTANLGRLSAVNSFGRLRFKY